MAVFRSSIKAIFLNCFFEKCAGYYFVDPCYLKILVVKDNYHNYNRYKATETLYVSVNFIQNHSPPPPLGKTKHASCVCLPEI